MIIVLNTLEIMLTIMLICTFQLINILFIKVLFLLSLNLISTAYFGLEYLVLIYHLIKFINHYSLSSSVKLNPTIQCRRKSDQQPSQQCLSD